MKVTIEVSDDVFRKAKAHAAARGISFRELVESGLRHVLREDPSSRKFKFKLRDCSFRGDGLAQGVAWDELLERAYERSSRIG